MARSFSPEDDLKPELWTELGAEIVLIASMSTRRLPTTEEESLDNHQGTTRTSQTEDTSSKTNHLQSPKTSEKRERELETNPEELNKKIKPDTSLVGWKDFLPVDMYLVDWKEILPAVEVQVPRRLEGNPSSLGYPLGYPDTHQYFAEKGPSASG
ncbi:hypothetical protein PGT21_018417 [Puccinia graminis f. sp. tritici]|uniref:Uncharacterized protein n=1 Tax=Puccinia graminis f. sp. tritici TaxID=56615 RepID=A0A5B0QNJ1_PUCGR|nr:hypothetical protein PGT21_018417 [Puccinia graminis f. sp. tritici]